MSQPTEAGARPRDGRSTRWDPHRQQRRMAIITAAIDAIDRYGPDALTGQIAEIAGVPRTHVYRHFDGKRALDTAVSAYVANQIGEQIRAGLAIQGSAREIISASIDQHLGWIEQHPNLYRFLTQHAYVVKDSGEQGVIDAKAAFATELTALVRRYAEALGGDVEPAEHVIVGVVGLVDATAAWWIERRVPSRNELTAELTEQVWLIIGRSAQRLGLSLAADQQLPAV
jgi:AcrR family transcriptional regulator